MQIFLSPMHMMKGAGIGDIAIGHKNPDGSLIFKNTKTKMPKIAKKHTLVNFFSGGTGFIISKKKIIIGFKRKKFALVLTAGHVVCNLETFQPFKSKFKCNLEDGEPAIAYFLKSYMHDYPHELQSAFTNANYCLPGDLAILLLKIKSGKTNYYRISSRARIGYDIVISGFPIMPENLEYCFPQVEGTRQDEILKKANKFFCQFDKKVYAEGRIENENNGLIEVSCSTTNGMSGGPIICKKKCVGVYIGGPPVPGQRECLNIKRRLAQNDNPIEIMSDLRDLCKYDVHFSIPQFSRLLDIKFVKDYYLIGKFKAGEKLTKIEKKRLLSLGDLDLQFKNAVNLLSELLLGQIYRCMIFYKNKDLLKANVGISVLHQFFGQQIRNEINKFTNCTVFSSSNDLIEYLKN